MLAKGFWFHASGLLNSNIIRSPGTTPKITAHYCEFTRIRLRIHLDPHVGKNTKCQFTIANSLRAATKNVLGTNAFVPMYQCFWPILSSKCLSFSHQHRKPNFKWISSLSESDRLEIQLKFGFGHWYSGGPELLPGCWGGQKAKLANSSAIMNTSAVISVLTPPSIKF